MSFFSFVWANLDFLGGLGSTLENLWLPYGLFWVIGVHLESFGILSHLEPTGVRNRSLTMRLNKNKGIGDAGSTADLRMLWSAIVCLGVL